MALSLKNRALGDPLKAPKTPTSPADMQISQMLKDLGFRGFGGLLPKEAKKGSTAAKPPNPFGAAISEFNVAPLAPGGGAGYGFGGTSASPIKTGNAGYDSMLSNLYPVQQTPPPGAPGTPGSSTPPTTTPTDPHAISGLHKSIQDMLTQLWGKIGGGGTMPTSLNDFILKNREWLAANPKHPPKVPGQPKPPKPGKKPPGGHSNPLLPLTGV